MPFMNDILSSDEREIQKTSDLKEKFEFNPVQAEEKSRRSIHSTIKKALKVRWAEGNAQFIQLFCEE